MGRGFGDPEVLGDLVERSFSFPSDSDDLATVLGGKGFGHDAHSSCE
jgi:hypothetical protein